MAEMKRPFEEGLAGPRPVGCGNQSALGRRCGDEDPRSQIVGASGDRKAGLANYGGRRHCALVTAHGAAKVAGMQPGELDLSARTWILPRARTKAKREHVVPLLALATNSEELSAAAALRLGRAQRPMTQSFRRHARQKRQGRDWRVRGLSAAVGRRLLCAAMSRLCELAGVTGANRTRSAAHGKHGHGSGADRRVTEVVSRLLNHAPAQLGRDGSTTAMPYLPRSDRPRAWSRYCLSCGRTRKAVQRNSQCDKARGESVRSLGLYFLN